MNADTPMYNFSADSRRTSSNVKVPASDPKAANYGPCSCGCKRLVNNASRVAAHRATHFCCTRLRDAPPSRQDRRRRVLIGGEGRAWTESLATSKVTRHKTPGLSLNPHGADAEEGEQAADVLAARLRHLAHGRPQHPEWVM